MKVQFRDGARLGVQATRRSDVQARERRPPVGKARPAERGESAVELLREERGRGRS